MPLPAALRTANSLRGSAERDRWRLALRHPDWYRLLEPVLHQYVLRRPRTAQERLLRRTLYDLAAEALAEGTIPLGDRPPTRESERLPLRYVVVHHSGTTPSITASRLSAMGLLRLYAPAWLDRERHPARWGTPVASGHWRDGRQVFHPYHWLLRPDGSAERLLEECQIGWHAGDWEVNRASIGVCIAGDYRRRPPPDAVLETLGALLREYAPARALPHFAVNLETDCPGRWVVPFLAGTGAS